LKREKMSSHSLTTISFLPLLPHLKSPALAYPAPFNLWFIWNILTAMPPRSGFFAFLFFFSVNRCHHLDSFVHSVSLVPLRESHVHSPRRADVKQQSKQDSWRSRFATVFSFFSFFSISLRIKPPFLPQIQGAV